MSYNIEVFEGDDLSLFNKNLQEFETDIYHNPLWVEANQNLQNGTFFLIHIQNGVERAYLPLVKRAIDNTEYFDLITPYGYGGIAFTYNATDDFKNNVLEKVDEYLRKTDCVSVFLRLHPLLNKDLHESDYLYSNGFTLAVDLQRDFDDVRKTYSSGHRYDIKKSLKNTEIVVMDDLEFHCFDSFIEIYTETMNLLQASDFYFFDNTYFYNLKKKLGNHLKLIVVKLGDDVIGTSLFMLHNNIIQYHLSGTSKEGRGYQPSKLILDYVIRWGIKNNYKYLHLGGGVGGDKDHLYQFKKRFGAIEFEFCTVRMVTNQKIYTDLCKLLDYSEEQIENTADFFPLYRK